MDVRSASELAGIVGAAGLASNLAALRALATDGIQQGHMRMHRRAVESNVPLTAAPRALDGVVTALGDSRGQSGSGAVDGSRSARKCA
jgi:hydroxymethylglutaryl-CoA reductase